MSVNPGNAGQMYLPYAGKKITKLLSIKEDMDFELYWDGACSKEKIIEFSKFGARCGQKCGQNNIFTKIKQPQTLYTKGFTVVLSLVTRTGIEPMITP